VISLKAIKKAPSVMTEKRSFMFDLKNQN